MDKGWLATLLNGTISLALLLSSHYSDKGIKFTDINGATFDEYLLYLLKAYWKGGKARRVYRGRRITWQEYAF